jgi:hypothetical protein
MDYIGVNSFSPLIVRRDRLPKDISKKYIYHKKVQATVHTWICQFLKPIILEKKVQVSLNKKYKKLHIAI